MLLVLEILISIAMTRSFITSPVFHCFLPCISIDSGIGICWKNGTVKCFGLSYNGHLKAWEVLGMAASRLGQSSSQKPWQRWFTFLFLFPMGFPKVYKENSPTGLIIIIIIKGIFNSASDWILI